MKIALHRKPKGVSSQYRTTLTFKKDMQRNWTLYLLFLPILLHVIIFKYVPMYGTIIAFKDFRPNLGIWGSPWVGFKHFIKFFNEPIFDRLLQNTLRLSVFGFIFGLPFPILFAILLHEIPFKKLKNTVQTISIFPHFVSTVVVCGIIRTFCASDGLFNTILNSLGIHLGKPLLQIPEAFAPIFIGSNIWAAVGWGSLIYIAAIGGVDPEVYDAAAIDGAGRLQKIWYIMLPSIKPVFTLQLIMSVGGLLNVGSEKILLLYNETIYSKADVISTYLYRKGLIDMSFSYSAAIDLLNAVIAFILTLIANSICRKVNDISLF